MKGLLKKLTESMIVSSLILGSGITALSQDKILDVIFYPNMKQIEVVAKPEKKDIKKLVVLGEITENKITPLAYGEVYSDDSIKMGNKYSEKQKKYFEEILRQGYGFLKNRKQK